MCSVFDEKETGAKRRARFPFKAFPFKGTRKQLTADEVQETIHIASVRIHVERAIGRIKNYHILDGILPVSVAHLADQIFYVCAYLTNFLPPLLQPRITNPGH